jgi:thiamine-monophosphate kinase
MLMDRTVNSSDEPTRLSEIIVPLFTGPERRWSTGLRNGSGADLLAGVAAQDDCAVFSLRGDQELVLGSDYIRGPKFRLYEQGRLNDYDIGYYLAMANFSDVAAMGAQPIALLSVIRYPRQMADEHFAVVLEGIAAACAEVGAPNVGGDIGTAERLILSGSAIGVVEPGRSLRRNGARPGDRLCVTGPTGIAAAAQRYYGDPDPTGLSASQEAELLASWKRPRALIREGRCLSASGAVTSCQDSSDGIKASVQSIADLSGVGFVVDESSLPVAELVNQVAKLTDGDVTQMILGDSVDFQLVFTVQEEGLPALREAFDSESLSLYEIGKVTEGPDVVLRRWDGTTTELPGNAWRHAT